MPMLTPVTRTRNTRWARAKKKLRKHFYLIIAVAIFAVGFAGLYTHIPQTIYRTYATPVDLTVNQSVSTCIFYGELFTNETFSFEMPQGKSVSYAIHMVQLGGSKFSPTLYYEYLKGGNATNGYTVQVRMTTYSEEYYQVNLSTGNGEVNVTVIGSFVGTSTLPQPLWLTYFSLALVASGAVLGVVYITVRASREENAYYQE